MTRMDVKATRSDLKPVVTASKRLGIFERYLSLWVGLCMVMGVAFGQGAPRLIHDVRSLEFGSGSHINLPIAVLIWLMIIPMMMKVDFVSIKKRLIIELDGTQHLEQEAYDIERTRYLESQGYKVIRFWNNDVENDINGVIRVIGSALIEK